MLSYKTKLHNKINTREIRILFIGQNEFSQNLCLSLANRGFETYFYADSTLSDVNKLLNSGVHITGIVYDFYDVDAVILTVPALLSKSKGVDYLKEALAVLKLMYHNGMLFLVDETYAKYSKEGLLEAIRSLAYFDPAEPVLETSQDGSNFFFCDICNTSSAEAYEVIKARISDSLQLGVELIKGANVK